MEPEPTFPEYFRRKNDDPSLPSFVRRELISLLGEENLNINLLTDVVMMLIPMCDIRSLRFLAHLSYFLGNYAQLFVYALHMYIISPCPIETEHIVQEYRKNETIQILQLARATSNTVSCPSTGIEAIKLQLGYEDRGDIILMVLPQEMQMEAAERILHESEAELLSIVHVPVESIEMKETEEKK
ncbi:hypothetical protein NPIL_453751 [Nephila pilipes]|uniref:Uncharacterized protein n=1 Tax=Nephila pilipes TaxID=299642 RepID=A0A8X6ND74_NEPPI|nr:hypothetical protein NPIL_453751 [Nephila pilipes]